MNDVEMAPAGAGRMLVALGLLAVLAAAVWGTMDPGKYRSLTWVLLGFFAFRVVLGWVRAGRVG